MSLKNVNEQWTYTLFYLKPFQSGDFSISIMFCSFTHIQNIEHEYLSTPVFEQFKSIKDNTVFR